MVEWELVATGTERLPVPGGWIYAVWDADGRPVAAVYVPDPTAVRDRQAARRPTPMRVVGPRARPLED